MHILQGYAILDAHDDAAVGILLQCAGGHTLAQGAWSHWRQRTVVLKPSALTTCTRETSSSRCFMAFKAHAVVGGNAGHFTAAAGAALVGYDLDMFSHGPFPRMQRAGP